MVFPTKSKYVIIGAGIHGLSCAWALGERLERTGEGSGSDILVIDKTAIAAGACGVIRNNYFQPAMRELMAHSVAVWDSDPDAFAYHPVGYMQISHEGMRGDIGSIYEQQNAIGYESEFIEGEADSFIYMKAVFSDWRAKTVWDMLDLPREVSIKGSDGTTHDGIPTRRYWCLEEGVLGVDPDLQKTNDGKMPPVIHVDTDAPLYSDVDGSLVRDEPWGIYYKPDFHFGGIHGGAMPYEVMTPADDVAIDPYGARSPEFIVGDDFAHMWCSALAFCQERFSGQIGKYKTEPSGGLGCFTPDSFPIFDRFCENVYFIADSNHGYKMIGVGHLVAEELLGNGQALLEPFRFSRYAEGRLHPTSNSPFPWS